MKFRIAVYLILFCIFQQTLAQSSLQDAFAGFTGTIVVYDLQADSFTVVNPQRAEVRYSPFSTFKIPNSIIALESGVVADTTQLLLWDQEKYPAADWWPLAWRRKQHRLGSAFKNSVVPVYRDLATQIGEVRMQSYVDGLDYGNRDISAGIDMFWLGASIKISAYEQIDFLRRLYDGKLGISEQTSDLVKSIMIQEKTANYTIRAKTGGGYPDGRDDLALGWYVGYVETKQNVFFFALNIEGPDFAEILAPRIRITRQILRELGII